MGCLVVTVQAAGAIYAWNGGSRSGSIHRARHSISGRCRKPLVGAATSYFLINTAMVATAIALSTRQTVVKIWNENFLWSAPSYFVGASVAAASVSILSLVSSWWWALPLAVAPLYLTYTALQGLSRTD